MSNRNNRMAKKMFYCSLFEKHKNDIKKTWVNIKEVLANKGATKGYLDIFIMKGEQANNKAKIPLEFKKYF